MNKITKRIVNIGVIVVLFGASILPTVQASAIENGNDYASVNMRDATSVTDESDAYMFHYDDGVVHMVNTTTDIVASGTIDLGDTQTTLDYGVARLDVMDAKLSASNIAEFESAAEGYEIKNYLDISLYNVTCKGAATCAGTEEDSWSERVRELNEPATITLQFEDGIDGNDVVIVHEKHDGTYEVIQTTYDVSTNTITFATSSFSNYAIASRTVATPDTGKYTGETSAIVSIAVTGEVGLVLIATVRLAI